MTCGNPQAFAVDWTLKVYIAISVVVAAVVTYLRSGKNR